MVKLQQNIIFIAVQLFTFVNAWCYYRSLKLADDVQQVDYSPNGQYLVVGLANRQVNLIYTSNYSIKCSYTDSININVIKFFPNNSGFIVGRDDPTIRVRNVTDCTSIQNVNTGHTNVHGVDFDSSGTRILTCGSDEKFKIWSSSFVVEAGGFATGQRIWSCDFSSDDYVITGDQAATVKIYSTPYTNPPIYTRTLSSGGNVISLSFKQGSHTQWVAGVDVQAFVDNKTSTLASSTSPVGLAQYDNLADHFVIGVSNKVRIYQQADHTKVEVFNQPTDNINCGDFREDSMYLAVGSKDQYLYIYTRCVLCLSAFNTNYSNYCPDTYNTSSNSSDDNTTDNNTTNNATDNCTDNCTDNSTNNTTDNCTNNCTDNSTNNTTDNCTDNNCTDNQTNTCINNCIQNCSSNCTDGNCTDANCTDNCIDNCTNQQQTNCTGQNCTNLTQLLDSLFVEQFFTNYFTKFMLNTLPEVTTHASIHSTNTCNNFIIKVDVPASKCNLYVQKQQYIFIYNKNISKKKCTCSQQHILLISVQLTDTITQKQFLIVLPKQSTLSTTIPLPLSQWQHLFQYIPVSAADSLLNFQIQYKNQCQSQDVVDHLMMALTYISLFVFLVGIVSGKITGLELFGLLQLAFYDLSNHGNINILLLPLVKLGITNGVKITLSPQNLTQLLPNNMNQMQINSQFVNNYNIVLIVGLFLVGCMCVVYLTGRIKNNNKIKYWSLRCIYEGTTTLVMFSTYNIFFSSGIHMKYSHIQATNAQFHIFSTIVMILCILMVFMTCFMICCKSQNYLGQFKNKFKNNFVCQFYIPLSILYRACIGYFISYQNDYQEIVLLILILPIFFIMFTGINLPFKSTLHNYRAMAIHITQALILWVANYYRSMKSNTSSEIKAHLTTPSIVQIVMITLCVFLSMLVMLYEVVIWIRYIIKLNQSKLVPQNNNKNQQSYTQEVINTTVCD